MEGQIAKLSVKILKVDRVPLLRNAVPEIVCRLRISKPYPSPEHLIPRTLPALGTVVDQEFQFVVDQEFQLDVKDPAASQLEILIWDVSPMSQVPIGQEFLLGEVLVNVGKLENFPGETIKFPFEIRKAAEEASGFQKTHAGVETGGTLHTAMVYDQDTNVDLYLDYPYGSISNTDRFGRELHGALKDALSTSPGRLSVVGMTAWTKNGISKGTRAQIKILPAGIGASDKRAVKTLKSGVQKMRFSDTNYPANKTVDLTVDNPILVAAPVEKPQKAAAAPATAPLNQGPPSDPELVKLLREFELEGARAALETLGLRTASDVRHLDDKDVPQLGLSFIDQKKMRSLLVAHQERSSQPSPTAAGSSPAASKVESEPQNKFVAATLVFGTGMQAGQGLEAILGLHPRALGPKIDSGAKAVQEEFFLYGSEEDQANFEYVFSGVAQETLVPPSVLKAAAAGKYHGGRFTLDMYDKGHKGMDLEAFRNTEQGRAGGLSLVEVGCLRLYTTSSYPRFNKPLREQTKPHPFAMTVYHAANGIKKLRAFAASSNAKGFNKTIDLFRGMKNRTIDFEAFEDNGGTELAFMSTTSDLAVAKSYASSDRPLIFKYRARGLSKGCSIRFLSVYPEEEEFLYPPLTYLNPEGPPRDEDGAKIIEVSPQMA